ncbi:hypothetical protein RND71_007952 [Anisodus tanguticus]|uniref:Uncharacterized protein n=1 Tax=Anisodus tanguticus TaxID=243964 RepID=A0AAE1SJW9_9SOLA|nr:hypothetical protein RND71_007952 [Anisodus tanguticus]
MGCGESKHAVATENATIPKSKRSLSSKSNSTKGEIQENVIKFENGESGVAENVKKSDEKVEVIAKVEEVIAPEIVAKKEEVKESSEKKEMVELEKAKETEEVVEKKEEKVVETQPEETPAVVSVAVAIVEKKESVEEKTEETIKPIEGTDVVTAETAKDAAKPETEERPKEENAAQTSATGSKTD